MNSDECITDIQLFTDHLLLMTFLNVMRNSVSVSSNFIRPMHFFVEL